MLALAVIVPTNTAKGQTLYSYDWHTINVNTTYPPFSIDSYDQWTQDIPVSDICDTSITAGNVIMDVAITSGTDVGYIPAVNNMIYDGNFEGSEANLCTWFAEYESPLVPPSNTVDCMQVGSWAPAQTITVGVMVGGTNVVGEVKIKSVTVYCGTEVPVDPTPAYQVEIPLTAGGSLLVSRSVSYGDIAVVVALMALFGAMVVYMLIRVPRLWK